MRSLAIAACMLVGCAGLVRADGLSPADLARTLQVFTASGGAGDHGLARDSARYDDYRLAPSRADARTCMAHTTYDSRDGLGEEAV